MNYTPPMFRGRWAFLSNFYSARVHYKGRWYLTAEHAYQAAKTTCTSDHDLVAGALTPADAKRAFRRLRLPQRQDWVQIKDGVMLEVLRAKFSTPGQAVLALLLLETGEQELIEHNPWHDTYWGVCDGVGQNKLGKLLMQVREELRSAQ